MSAPSPPFLMKPRPSVPETQYDTLPPLRPHLHPRLSPSPLARQPPIVPITQPLRQEIEYDAPYGDEDEDEEIDEELESQQDLSDQDRFVRLYGEDVWANFQRITGPLVVPHLTPELGEEGGKAQVTIELVVVPHEVDEEEEEDERYEQRASNYQVNTDVLSAPKEGVDRWAMRRFSAHIPGSPNKHEHHSTEAIAYALDDLHACIQQHGFSIVMAESRDRSHVSEMLIVHTGKSERKEAFLPLHFRIAPADGNEPNISVAFCKYLLDSQRQTLAERAEKEQKEAELKRGEAGKVAAATPTLTIRQRGELLDKRAAELRNNVPRFKRMLEEDLQDERARRSHANSVFHSASTSTPVLAQA